MAEILRPIFRENFGTITLHSEMDCLEKYIFILSHRFGNQIILNVNLPPELENSVIPQLILQPIVENCVSHGQHADGRVLSIQVSVSSSNGDLEISVIDDGKGIPNDKLAQLHTSFAQNIESEVSENEHLGLINVHKRIVLQYGKQYGVTVNSSPGSGTSVIIRLPLIECNESISVFGEENQNSR